MTERGAPPLRPVLRPAHEADAASFRSLYHEARAADFASLPLEQRGPLLDMQYDIQERSLALQFTDAQILAIELDGIPVGRLILHRDGDHIHIVDIIIAQAQRGRGVGAIVLRRAQDMAGPTGRVTLSVRPGNPAQRLYARLGFAPNGAEAHDPAMSIPMIWRPRPVSLSTPAGV